MEHQCGFPVALLRSVRAGVLCMDAALRIRLTSGRDLDPLDNGVRLGQGANEGSRGMEGSLPDREPTQRAGEGGL